MALTLEQQNNLLINNDLKGRVRTAALRAARNLQNDTNVTDRLIRKYCNRIRNNPFGDWINNYMFLVSEHPQSALEMNDTLLQAIVDSVFTDATERYYANI